MLLRRAAPRRRRPFADPTLSLTRASKKS
ncbi:hypothetical protein EYF80_058232 [Liparis tanakae]|uniref:Uncharacterized protein n=1 Tax=Liparis tanakae TaxID=230148 RepID=A0A4Z2ES24_9TELE|nr:hypothetical protein EYF80_058232 [Liparis tanakae]